MVVPNGHETVTCGGIAATPCLFPQKEGDHPRQRMVKDIHSRRGNACPSKGAYPQSVLRLTAPAPLQRDPFGSTSLKASPERGGARRRRAEGFVPKRPHVRGGSVSRRGLNQAAGNRTQRSGGTNYAEVPKSNASRSSGEGVWGRGASLREAASPPESPHCKSLGEGARGRGLLFREAPSLAIFTLSQSLSFAMMMRRRRERMLVMAAAT